MTAELVRRGLRDHRRALVGWCVGIAALRRPGGIDLPVDRELAGAERPHRELPGHPEVAVRHRRGRKPHVRRRIPRRRALQLHAAAPRPRARDRLRRADVRGRGGRGQAGARSLVSRATTRAPCSPRESRSPVEVLLACAAATLTILAFDQLVGLDLSLAHVGSAFVSLAVLGLFYGWFALAVGAAYPSRGLAIGRRRREPRPRATSSAGSTSSRAGSTRSASCRRSGSSDRRRCRPVRTCSGPRSSSCAALIVLVARCSRSSSAAISRHPRSTRPRRRP